MRLRKYNIYYVNTKILLRIINLIYILSKIHKSYLNYYIIKVEFNCCKNF